MRQAAQRLKQNTRNDAIVAVLLVSTFTAVLNQTLLNTALPSIMTSLSVSENTAQWIITSFMLVNGIMIPITAFFIEMFTTRTLFFLAMGLFAVGTLMSGVAPNFALLLVGRIVQAAGAGVIMPLMQTVLFIIYPVEKRGSAMGLAGLAIAFAPAIGPTLSGWLVDHYSWRAPFLILLPITIGAIIYGIFALRNVTTQTNPTIDVTSIVLSTLGFGGLLYGLSSAGTNSWNDGSVLYPSLIGAVALTLFIRRQLAIESPILDVRVFRYPAFSLSTVITMITMMGMFGATFLIPLYVQNLRGFTALESGMLLLPGAIVMGAMSPVTGRLFDRYGARWLAFTGLAIITGSTYVFSQLSSETPYTTILATFIIRMFGMAMVMMPVTTAGLNQLPKRLIAHGSAMINTLRTIAGSIGTALLVTIMSNAAKGYTVRLSEQVGVSINDLPPNALNEAMIHGVNTAFLVATFITLLAMVCSWFIESATPGRRE